MDSDRCVAAPILSLKKWPDKSSVPSGTRCWTFVLFSEVRRLVFLIDKTLSA